VGLVKRLRYAGGSFVTGDRIADAVLAYAAELANAGKAVKLDVPAMDLEQQRERVSIVIGPASQIIAEPVVLGVEMDDEIFTEQLRRKTSVLQSKTGTGQAGDASAFSTS
jgi:glycine/D-amino acid oxidase-like deaminating enzyme